MGGLETVSFYAFSLQNQSFLFCHILFSIALREIQKEFIAKRGVTKCGRFVTPHSLCTRLAPAWSNLRTLFNLKDMNATALQGMNATHSKQTHVYIHIYIYIRIYIYMYIRIYMLRIIYVFNLRARIQEHKFVCLWQRRKVEEYFLIANTNTLFAETDEIN